MITASPFIARVVADRTETRRLMAWLLCWILLPNAGFWLLWIVGAPPRYPEILAGGAIGLLVRRHAFSIQFAAFVLLITFSVMSFVAALFNLGVASLMASIPFLVEMRPGTSIEYIVCAIGVLVTLISSVRLLRLRTDFTTTPMVAAAIALTLGAAGIDHWMSFDTRGAYKHSAPHGAAFASAVARSGFAAAPTGKRHLILVMVESMGQPKDPVMRARLSARWRQPDIAARYQLTEGTTPYFGSTTSGEIRELCGRWGDYYDVRDHRDDGCLPTTLRRAGYDANALHSFDGAYFDRSRWYSNIGFSRSLFADALIAEGAHGCPGVFPGACDRDVPAILARRLKAARGPQFVYWLTVNSHLPVPAAEELRTTDCRADEPAAIRRYPMICRQFGLWRDMSERLAEQMLQPDFPPADILLVGDHMPPYFDRTQRSQFDPATVPWMLLRHKPDSDRTRVLAVR